MGENIWIYNNYCMIYIMLKIPKVSIMLLKKNDFLTRSSDNGSIEITTLDYGDRGGKGDHFVLANQDAQKLKVQIAGPYDGEIQVIVEPKKSTEVGERIPLSIKMISSAGDMMLLFLFGWSRKIINQKRKKRKRLNSLN